MPPRPPLLLLLWLACVARVGGHGVGAWKDPNHYVGPHSFAGMRFIGEAPGHGTMARYERDLALVGSDDGVSWWTLEGRSRGSELATITFDFSSQGGPAALSGTWEHKRAADTLTWPDGNVWVGIAQPTIALAPDAGVHDKLVGVFRCQRHYKGPDSFAGLRYVSEQPAHTLTIVGTDDGTTWWVARGHCSGARMSVITVDFAPLGGPAALTGRWEPLEEAPGRILWGDGEAWVKVSYASAVVGASAAAREVAEEKEEEGRQGDGHHEGPEEEVEERPCVRGVCNMALHRAQAKVSEEDEDDEGHGNGHEHEHEHEHARAPRPWWQPFEREYYYVPLESWWLHMLTIAIFGLPTAAVLLYIHSRPDLSRTLCLV